MTTYRVIILGIKPGQNADVVLQKLAATFRQPIERMGALVSGSRTTVKHGVELSYAAAMQVAIEATGCDCVVEPETSESERDKTPSQTQAAASDLRTGRKPVGRAVRDRQSTWLDVFRNVTQKFGWEHWAAAGLLGLGIIFLFGLAIDAGVKFLGGPGRSAASPSSVAGVGRSVATSSSVGGTGQSATSPATVAKVLLAKVEADARKFGNEVCTSLEDIHSKTIAEGTMNGGDVGFNGRTLPAAIVEVSAVCVNSVLGTKKPYAFVAVAAFDAEFKYWRAWWDYQSIGERAPRKEGFDQHVARNFRSR